MSSINPQLRFLTLSVPRHGHDRGEYEDAAAANLDLGRFAIADGASESSYAGLWAQLLVDEFVKLSPQNAECWENWLPALQTRWELAVGAPPLPWYAEIKWQQGAFATFLGIVVQPPRWQALAVGDSCLFHIRAEQLLCAFPLTQAAEFTASPWLVGSRGFAHEAMAVRQRLSEGEFLEGDRLLLMTDALAHWFLQQAETGQNPWQAVHQWLTAPCAEASFAARIDALRDAGQLRNDDVTLLAIW